MTTKERIINRLNKGFGFEIPLDAPYHHHGGRGLFTGCWSWSVSTGLLDIGSTDSMTECLKWKKWIYDNGMHEIFEYRPENEEMYRKVGYITIEEQ